MSQLFDQQHIPALLIVLPLMAAPVTAFLRHPRISWWISLGVNLLCLGMSMQLITRVAREHEILYNMGGWLVPYGIQYRIDPLNALILFLISLVGTLCMMYAPTSVVREVGSPKRSLFYAAYLLCFTGLLGMTITGDAFNVFVFLEISSLSTYALVALGKDRRALTSAYRYLVLGTIAATFILIAIGLMYMLTGTLNMGDMAQGLRALPPNNRTLIAAFAFLTVGIALKLALFPVHRWLPNAYTFAPSVVSAFIAATATKVALYLLLRFFFTIFGLEFSFTTMRLNAILLPLSLAAMFYASLKALFKDHLKRMLAYSSIAQIGYMTLGISIHSQRGIMAAILHLFNHALMKGTLFMALGCIAYRIGEPRLRSINGLARRMPWTFGAFVVGGLSLIGVPLTAGFVSKWYLLAATIENGTIWIPALILVTSLMAVVYIGRVIERAMFGEPDAATATLTEAPLGLLIPTWIFALSNIYFGVNPGFTLDLARLAAETLAEMGR